MVSENYIVLSKLDNIASLDLLNKKYINCKESKHCTNCTNCTNCYNCYNCYNCTNCIFCTDCYGLKDGYNIKGFIKSKI